MKQDNEQKVQPGPLKRFVNWLAYLFEVQVDRLVALRAFDDRRYDYSKPNKQ